MTQTRPIREIFEGVPGCLLQYALFFSGFLYRLLGHEAAHPLGGILLHLSSDVGVSIQREARTVVPQDAGDRFSVHSLLDRQRGKGVPQPVEGNVFGDSSLLQQIFVKPPNAVMLSISSSDSMSFAMLKLPKSRSACRKFPNASL